MTRLLQNPWLRLIAGLALVGVLAWALLALSGVLTPFAVAFTLAYFLNPGVNALERIVERPLSRWPWLRRRLEPRILAVGLLVLAVGAGLVLALLWLLPVVYRQVAETASKVPEYARVLRGRLEPLVARLNVLYPEQLEEVRRQLETALKSHWPEILSPVRRLLQVAFSGVVGFILAVLNLLVIPVVTAYLLYDMNHIRRGFRELVPYRFRDYAYSRIRQIDELLAAFVRGQLLVALILGSFYAVSLSLLGVPMGLPVGFVIGFFNLIPYMSFVLGLPLALALSWVDNQDLTRLLIVAGIFGFGQLVEGNFITPRVVGDRLGLHAVVVMLAVLIGGTLFGCVGMVLAVPATAALSVFWSDLRDLYLRSAFYRGGASPPGAGDAT